MRALRAATRSSRDVDIGPKVASLSLNSLCASPIPAKASHCGDVRLRVHLYELVPACRRGSGNIARAI
eukprot:scaffold724_cov333-Prasinococcus_capsulatus_cf.AAC.4